MIIGTYVNKLAVIVFTHGLVESTTLGSGILNPLLHAASIQHVTECACLG